MVQMYEMFLLLLHEYIKEMDTMKLLELFLRDMPQHVFRPNLWPSWEASL